MTDVRAYVAGTGESGSLLFVALVALLSVTAFVAFDGVPSGLGGREPERRRARPSRSPAQSTRPSSG